MKERWINLPLREKQFLVIGALFATIFLFYLLILTPLTHKISALRNTLEHNKITLASIQKTETKIQALEKNSRKIKTDLDASLLSIVQNAINQSDFSKEAAQLKQADNDAVRLSFPKVDFDSLIEWLTRLFQENNIVVTEAAVTKTPSEGIVTAEITVER